MQTPNEIPNNDKRVFIALSIPDDVKAHCVAVSKTLKEHLPQNKYRLIKPDNLHITLSFLGRIEQDLLESLYPVLDEICNQHTPFSVNLTHVLPFPEIKPNVIVYDMEQSKALKALATDIKQAVKSHGLTQDRATFHGHLTLARIDRNTHNIKLDGIGNNTIMAVNAITVYESQLGEHGANYEILKVLPLSN